MIEMPSKTLHETILGNIIIDPLKVALKTPGLCLTGFKSAISNFKKFKTSVEWKDVNPLLVAVDVGCLELVQCLIQEGADVNNGKIGAASPLNWALMKKHYDVASYLIQKGADVNCADCNGLTPMYHAIDENSPTSIIQDLLSRGVSKDCPLGRAAARGAARPIGKAVFHKNIPVVKFLLKQSVQLNYPLEPGDLTPLCRAVRDDFIEGIQLLIEYGAKVDGQDDEFLNPLVAAIFKNNVTSIRFLLAAGANISKSYDVGTIAKGSWRDDDPEPEWVVLDQFKKYIKKEPDVTALHFAVMFGRYDATKVLLEAGADVNKLTRFSKRTALSLYCIVQVNVKEVRVGPSVQQKMVRLLLDYGSDMHSTPVEICYFARLDSVLEEFVNAGIDVNAPYIDGASVLTIVTLLLLPNMIRLCLEHGGDCTQQVQKMSVYEMALAKGIHFAKIFFPYHPVDGFSLSLFKHHSRRNIPFLINQYKYFDGIKNNKENAVKMALKNGAEPKAFLKLMPFPIFHSVINQNATMLRMLLESGVRPNVQNTYARTPLHVAARKISAECCLVLLKHGACYNARCSDGQSPLQVAKRSFGEEVIHLLKDIHLMFCKAAQGDVEYVKKLLAEMPDKVFYSYVNCVNRKGNTLMERAIKSGASQVANAVMNLRLNREN